MLKERTFYHAKEYVNGIPTPGGGYLYILKIFDGNVSFAVTEQPHIDIVQQVGAFTISYDDFCKIAGDEYQTRTH